MFLSPQWLRLLPVLRRRFCLEEVFGPCFVFQHLFPSSFVIILFPGHTHLLFIAMVSSLIVSVPQTQWPHGH